MDKHHRRFRCLPEPSGTWMVWDEATGAVATLGGCALRGRSEERARAACEILKRIYRNRLDAASMRDAMDALQNRLSGRRVTPKLQRRRSKAA